MQKYVWVYVICEKEKKFACVGERERLSDTVWGRKRVRERLSENVCRVREIERESAREIE